VAPVHQGDGTLHEKFGNKLGYHPRASLLGRIEGIEAGSDPVEGSKQGELQMSPGPIGIDHPVQKLLAAGIYPPFLLDGTDDEEALVFAELGIGTGAINLGGGGEYHPFSIFDTLLDDIEIHLEIEIVNSDGIFHV
jgi:hypothetical protein